MRTTIYTQEERERMSDQGAQIRGTVEIDKVRDGLRAAGMRWTPQRRVILEALLESGGDHVTGAEIVSRVQDVDAQTPPSTVYRTLDALESLGYVSHSHGRDGREEYHVLPDHEHAHIVCERCGDSWNISSVEIAPL